MNKDWKEELNKFVVTEDCFVCTRCRVAIQESMLKKGVEGIHCPRCDELSLTTPILYLRDAAFNLLTKLEQSHKAEMREAIEEAVHRCVSAVSIIRPGYFHVGISIYNEENTEKLITRMLFKKFNCEEEKK